MRIFVAIFLALTLILSGCSSVDEIIETGKSLVQTFTSDEEEVAEDIAEEAVDKVVDEQEAKEEEEEKVTSLTWDSELERVLLEAAEAFKGVRTVTVTGESKEEVEGMHSHVKITAKASLDPFIHHYVQEVISGDDEYGEWYADEEASYIATGDGGWMKMSVSGLSMAAQLFHSDLHYNHILENKDYFELTEDENNYIITFVASPEDYSKVFHSVMPDDLPFMDGAVGDMVDGMMDSMTGEFLVKISKDTYLQTEMTQNTVMTVPVYGDVTMTVASDSTYFYKYNEFDSLEIPEEIIANAQEFSF